MRAFRHLPSYFFGLWVFSCILPVHASIVSATLPTSRSVQVGQTATAFGTIINAGTDTATACGLALGSGVDASFSYQTTDSTTNAASGNVDTPIDVAAGAAQSYIFFIEPNSAFSPTEVTITFDCSNTDPAPIFTGLNTLLLSASTTPVPDIVALAVANGAFPGTVDIAETNAIGVFSVASVNVGVSGSITITADDAGAGLPIGFLLCETDPATAACINPTVPSADPVVTTIDANDTPTFAVFVTQTSSVTFDPAGNRAFLRFKDSGGLTRGATSVAVQTAIAALALSGEVATFPDTSSSQTSLKILGGAEQTQTEFGQDDMQGTGALVSLYLLSDTARESPIATIKTSADGSYDVRANDVVDYLVAQGLVAAGVSDDAIITAFKALGQLQVSALIVEEEADGTLKAISIQTIADPTSTEAVKINPIVHRVVKTILDQIVAAVNTLTSLGLSQDVVDTLAKNIVAEVAKEIITVLKEAGDSVLQIPDGQTAADIFGDLEDDFEVTVAADELEVLQTIIEETDELNDEDVSSLGADVLTADAVKTESDLSGSLSGEDAGLVAGLDSTLTDTLLGQVDNLDSSDFQNADAAAAADASKVALRREGLQKFFLSMGFSVVVAQDTATNTSIIVTALPTPPHIPDEFVPGQRAFGERGFRYFKIGDGVISGDFSDAVTLTEEIATKLAGVTQASIDEIFQQGPSTEAEFELLDRLRLYQELLDRVESNPLVSDELTNFIIANAKETVRVKKIASVVAENFQWVQELVNVTDDGFPIFTGRVLPVSGASTVDASELVRFLSFRLEENPGDAAKALTSAEQFFSQFAPETIEIQLQELFDNGIDDRPFDEILADVYPDTIAGYKDLILGNKALGLLPSPPYKEARDRVARGITAAFPPDLFGTSITSESAFNIRPAFFLVNYLLRSKFAVDQEQGFFTELTLAGQTRLRPNFENVKSLEPNGDLTIAGFMASLLDTTAIEESDTFGIAQAAVFQLLDSLPRLPEFEEQNLDDFDDFLDAAVDSVSVSCIVERFDGLDARDPFGDGGAQEGITVKVFPIDFDDRTGDFFKGSLVTQTTTGTVSEVDGRALVNYSLSGISALRGTERGREYIMQFDIPSYENPLPELFFYVDGFDADLNLCDEHFPWFIPPDEEFIPVPGVGLVADQARFDEQGNEQLEGIDLSNIEVPGGFVYLTQEEEDAGFGKIDFNLVSTESGFQLSIFDATSGGGFAPLFGQFGAAGVQASLTQGTDDEPLYGIYSVLGNNIRDAVTQAADGTVSLSTTITIETDPDLFEYDRLYLFRDADGQYWVIELRFADIFEDFDGSSGAFIDLGFASINSVGEVQLSQPAFDAGFDDGFVDFRYYYMGLGDWIILEPPTGYDGPDYQPPEIFSFGGVDYSPLENATDGVVIRYAGEYFDDNVTTIDEFDSLFEDGDFGDVPVRIDAVSTNISFIKLSFDNDNRQYILSPDPDSATSSVSNLGHGDIVVILDSAAADPGPAYLARVTRNAPDDDPFANFSISLEVVPFTPDSDKPGAEVACFLEDGPCPTDLPALYFSSDLATQQGVIFDFDSDGVPTVFDENDQDPNIPGAGGFDAGCCFQEGLFFEPIVESEGGVASNFIFVETQGLYPGDINQVSLRSADLFGDEELHSFFTCQAASDVAGTFTGATCTAGESVNGIEFEEDFQSFDAVAFELALPSSLVADLDRVFVEYEITFNQPLDPAGNPISCGDFDCEARSPISDEALIRITDASTVELFTNASIAVGNDSATPLGELSSLDVSRDLKLTASAVAQANDYSLEIFCDGNDDPFDFQPEEFLFFYAPGFDARGTPISPQFDFGIQFLGGRTCDIELSAFLTDASGEFLGTVIEVFDNIVFTGGNGGFFFDNEVRLETGDIACLVDGRVETTGCVDSNTLFVLDGTTQTSQGPSAQLTLGGSVGNAFFESFLPDLTFGGIGDGATVSFDINTADIEQRPTCGEVSSDQFSNFCQDNQTLTPLLVRTGDSLTIVSDLAATYSIQGDNEGVVDLTTFGYYQVVNSSGNAILEFGIDAFSGLVNIFARPASAVTDFNSDSDSDRSLTIQNPGFLFVQLQGVDQPVDFDVLAIREGKVKLAFYLPPPRRDLVGSHDVNADGVTDVTVTEAGDVFTFTFDDSLIVRRFDPSTGTVTEVTGAQAVDATEFFAEFEFNIGEFTYVFQAFNLDFDPQLEFFNFFTGDKAAPGGPASDGTTSGPVTGGAEGKDDEDDEDDEFFEDDIAPGGGYRR